MRPQVIVKIDPVLGGLKKVPQRSIAPSLGNCLLENPNEPFSIAVIGWRTRSAHGANEAFFEQHSSRLMCSILASLIGMEDGAGDIELYLIDGRDDEFGMHAVIKGQGQDMPGPLP